MARELRRHGIAYETVRVPLRKADRSEVVALTGQHVVPVLVTAGEAICDSKRIVEHLDWRYDSRGPT